MSKFLIVSSALVAFSSCGVHSVDSSAGSKLATITIKQDDVRGKMKGPAGDTDKDSVYQRLKYEIHIKSKECDTGISSTDTKIGPKDATETTASSIQLSRQCSYIVSMIYKDGDLALLASDDSTVNLSRDQMSQDTPTVKPVLKATSDGLKYWPAGSGQTPTGDAHVVITPTIDTSGGSTPTPGNSAPQIAVNVTMDAPWWPLGQAQVGVALKSTATGVSYQCSMLIKAFAANGSTKVELDRNVPTFTVPNADIAGTYNFSRSEFGSGYSPDHAEIVLSCTGFKDLTKSSK